MGGSSARASKPSHTVPRTSRCPQCDWLCLESSKAKGNATLRTTQKQDKKNNTGVTTYYYRPRQGVLPPIFHQLAILHLYRFFHFATLLHLLVVLDIGIAFFMEWGLSSPHRVWLYLSFGTTHDGAHHSSVTILLAGKSRNRAHLHLHDQEFGSRSSRFLQIT